MVLSKEAVVADYNLKGSYNIHVSNLYKITVMNDYNLKGRYNSIFNASSSLRGEWSKFER